MNISDSGEEYLSYESYPVWDRSVRVFHWINAICVIGLVFIGLAILYNKSLGVSAEGKILLKTIHVYIGYLFVSNLAWRIIWLFIGNRYARFKSVFPFGKDYRVSLGQYVEDLREGNQSNYLGHNPLARLMVALLFLLLTAQAVSGLVLAGTDIYYPPFGNGIKEWIAVDGLDEVAIGDIRPGSKENVDPVAYNEMRGFRKPFITVHKYAFYILLFALFLHIAGVVYSELKEGCGLVSAMFTGEKKFSQRPVDYDDD
ncbi:MAG: cytochrome b/b6 domain-containing protein [Sedimenticola sp.]